MARLGNTSARVSNLDGRVALIALAAAAILLPAAAQGDVSRPRMIGPNDTISVSVLGADDFNKNWRVDADGQLNLPLIGTVEAAGKTVPQLQSELATRLRKFYNDPQVTVYIAESRSQPVTIAGAVDKPGVYQIEDLRELCQVLLLAGGPKEAGPTVTVSRAEVNGVIAYPGVRIDGSNQVVELPLKDVLAGHGPAAEFKIMAHDIISVSSMVKDQKLVQVAGEVNRPGAIELVDHDSITLVQALAMAGGLSRAAAGGKARIVHIDAQGNTTFKSVDAGKALSGHSHDSDIPLHAGDLVVVPSSNVLTWVQAASLSAVSTGVLLLGHF